MSDAMCTCTCGPQPLDQSYMGTLLPGSSSGLTHTLQWPVGCHFWNTRSRITILRNVEVVTGELWSKHGGLLDGGPAPVSPVSVGFSAQSNICSIGPPNSQHSPEFTPQVSINWAWNTNWGSGERKVGNGEMKVGPEAGRWSCKPVCMRLNTWIWSQKNINKPVSWVKKALHIHQLMFADKGNCIRILFEERRSLYH